ncbi:MAG: hypothetical protein ACLFQV_10510 [Vulcanimicrobiota bacterium]
MMNRYSYQRAQKHMQKALEPQVKHCYIQDIDVNILVEYPDYKNPNVKGPVGEIYCENLMYCFQNDVKCRWSGISPHYPDPFNPSAPKHRPPIF